MTQHLNATYADIKSNSARVSRKMTLHISVLLLNVDQKFVRKYLEILLLSVKTFLVINRQLSESK